MTNEEIKKFLEYKNLRHGDKVIFEVENPSLWIGAREGTLDFSNDEPFIKCQDKKCLFYYVSINKGYDAYITTIKRA